jgi:bla regulator protein blaR1
MRAAIAVLSLLTSWDLRAQEPSAPLKFEVASIKPSASDERRVGIMFQPGGGLKVANAPLKMIIAFAYDVRDFQLSGGPGWIGSDRFDIEARPERTADDPASVNDPTKMTDEQRKTVQEQMRERVRNLLAERFQLVIRRESKEQSIYGLVAGKNGSKLKEAQGGRGPMLRIGGRGQLSGQGVEVAMLANTLSALVGRPVIDKTGLTGRYDFTLNWSPDPGQPAGPFGQLPPEAPPSDASGPSLFTAIQEQLGLRLESEKGPAELLVIERVEKPSEN